MAIDPLGGTLGSIALLFPVYDACNRLHDACKVMNTFARDIQLLWKQLDGQWVRFYLVMQREKFDLEDPIDSDDEHHRVTRAVLNQLTILETHFAKCEALVKAQFENSGISISEIGTLSRTTTTTNIPSLSSGIESSLSSGIKTPDTTDLISATAARRSKGSKVKSFVRKAYHFGKKSSESGGTSSSESSLTPTSAQSSSATSQPASTTSPLRENLPIIQTPQLRIETLSQQRAEARVIQQRTGVWTHIKWAHHAKEEFKEKIREIRETVDTLSQLLALKNPNEPRRLLAVRTRVASENYSTTELQQALERLHQALKSVNNALDHKPWSFSVGIAARPSDNWSLVNRQTDLPLRDGSLLFYIQRQNTADESTFLIIETLQSPGLIAHPQTNDDFPRLVDIDHPLPMPTLDRISGPYKPWGSISTVRDLHDKHNVFGEVQKWHRVKTLKDFLDDATFRDDLTLPNLIELAEIILVAYLDFCRVRASCSNTRLESFVYYQEPAAEGDDNTAESEGPLYLRPYLSCGFGGRPPERRIGATSRALKKDPNAAVIELGLVLFQLGSHEQIAYDARSAGNISQSLQKARKRAMKSLSAVENLYGPRFTRVIEVCLASNVHNEMEDVSDCLTVLAKMRESLTEVPSIIVS